jgi:hypothetical protein
MPATFYPCASVFIRVHPWFQFLGVAFQVCFSAEPRQRRHIGVGGAVLARRPVLRGVMTEAGRRWIAVIVLAGIPGSSSAFVRSVSAVIGVLNHSRYGLHKRRTGGENAGTGDGEGPRDIKGRRRGVLSVSPDCPLGPWEGERPEGGMHGTR